MRGTLYFADIRLVADTPRPDLATAIQRTDALPQTSSLEQNHPNPFNAETVILFELQEALDVELAVYNLAGQKVVRLADGSQKAGAHTVRWNGRDDAGRELASGVYVYRLRVGAQLLQARKMALLR